MLYNPLTPKLLALLWLQRIQGLSVRSRISQGPWQESSALVRIPEGLAQGLYDGCYKVTKEALIIRTGLSCVCVCLIQYSYVN